MGSLSDFIPLSVDSILSPQAQTLCNWIRPPLVCYQRANTVITELMNSPFTAQEPPAKGAHPAKERKGKLRCETSKGTLHNPNAPWVKVKPRKLFPLLQPWKSTFPSPAVLKSLLPVPVLISLAGNRQVAKGSFICFTVSHRNPLWCFSLTFLWENLICFHQEASQNPA